MCKPARFLRVNVPQALLTLLALAVGDPRPGICQAGSVAVVREELLGPESGFLPDGRPTPWTMERRGKSWLLRSAGWAGAEYAEKDLSPWPTASPDGKRFAFAGWRGAWVMVVDGKETGPYEELSFPVFSPDSQRLAYYAKKNGKWRAVVDGKEEPEFAGGYPKYVMHPPLAFSPDSQRVAYVAYSRTKGHLVVDGSAWPDCRKPGGPVFSPDSRHVVATCGRALLLDGREYGRFDLAIFAFHPKTSELVVLARSGDRLVSHGLGLQTVADASRRFTLTRVDTLQGTFYTGAAIHSLCFSADGSHFAYAITDDTQVDLYVDGRSVYHRRGPGSLLSLGLSPDAKRLAAMIGGDIVVDIELGPDPTTARWGPLKVREYSAKGGELFMSPSGRHLAYEANKPHFRTGEYWVVLDGQEGPHYQAIRHDARWESDDTLSYIAAKVMAKDSTTTTWYRVTQTAPASDAWTPNERP